MKTVILKLSILSAVFLTYASIFAQESTSGFDRSKLLFGGSLGLSFSNHYTIVNIAPQVGYQFNPYYDQLVYSVGYVFNF